MMMEPAVKKCKRLYIELSERWETLLLVKLELVIFTVVMCCFYF